MPDSPQNHEDELEDDDDSVEFELNLSADDKDGADSDVDLTDDKNGSDADVHLTRDGCNEADRAPTPNDSGERDVTPTPNDFTDILIRRGIIGADQVLEARSLQQQTGAKLQDGIVKLGYASIEEVMSAIAKFHGLQFIDLTEVTLLQSVVELVPESVARQNVVLPLSEENGILTLILSDPTDVDTIARLRFTLNKEIQPVLAPREQIVEAINRHYGQIETESVDSMLQEFTDLDIDFDVPEATQSGAAADDSDPLVRLVNLIIAEAITMRASDIHIEPLAERIRLRYRIDGLLVERDSPPRRLLESLLSRIKIMSDLAQPERPRPRVGRVKRLLARLLSRIKTKLNIDMSARSQPHVEPPQPQDGRIRTNVQGEHLDLRVRILPTADGESAAIRIVDRRNVQIDLGDLGFHENDLTHVRQIIERPSGMFLLTGPSGSGKTTTVYVALNKLNRPDRKIITVEDPVEYCEPGINQVQVKREIGLNQARVVRDILRQGPDILLVGEIRDHDSAQLALQASLAGNLVFSTLHTTRDAPSAITRLVDLGVQPFLIAGGLTAIMAQRLVRLICPRCKEPFEPASVEIQMADITADELANATFMRGRGCSHCHHTGYRGRVAIFELLMMSAAIRDLAFSRAPIQEIRRQARLRGMRTLMEDGVKKALKGLIALEEVLRACHHELQTDVTDVSGQ